MRKLVLTVAAVVSVCGSAPTSSPAQPPAQGGAPAAESHVPPNGVRDQLDQLSARIDRDLAQGRLSQKQAEQARRQVNDIAAQASTLRERHGGTLTVADHFAIHAQIERLDNQIHGERGDAAAPPSADH
ncbi:MAG TPA: hypothetical protein VGI79_02235 [Caulobacteraceae bacterium]